MHEWLRDFICQFFDKKGKFDEGKMAKANECVCVLDYDQAKKLWFAPVRHETNKKLHGEDSCLSNCLDVAGSSIIGTLTNIEKTEQLNKNDLDKAEKEIARWRDNASESSLNLPEPSRSSAEEDDPCRILDSENVSAQPPISLDSGMR
ncbi:MAG: hypothetical protein V1798_11090 [Pseudomonadota bacterium]